jgi:heme exporter protein C
MTAHLPTQPTGRALRASGLVLAALAVAWAAAVVMAPIDARQGVVQKILYAHVPCAFAAYLGFLVTAVAGALFLWRGDPRLDRVALAGAEVGVLFCTLVLVSGPLWAKATWGEWWAEWDPRLTVSLLQWFVYVAYLLLRAFSEGSERAARFAAVYGIAGVVAIPLNYFAIDLFGGGRAAHPDNLERGSLGEGFGLPFLAGVLAGLAAFLHLLLLRVDLETRRTALEEGLEALEVH